MTSSVIQLKCDCNNYPWGKTGSKSLAAQLASKTPGTDFKLDENKEYAEMWMGTYPTTPAYVLESGKPLQDVLNDNREQLIGSTVLNKFGSDLPYLPKILSIAKALPLQIHPNKDLAADLHKQDPDKFGDANHKPEIAVALSDFEAFCGFKTTQTIAVLSKLSPLQPFFSSPGDTLDSESIREVCRRMLLADEKTVATAMEGLKQASQAQLGDQAYIVDLVPRLIDQYGKTDNGSLVALVLMNYLQFQPGEALWIPADGIHAYLYGDIVECMARSDNVLNTGFCPRADRDSVDLFTQALTFKQDGPEKPLLPRVESEFSGSGHTTAFKPPMGEFNMLVTELAANQQETVKAVNGPSIMFVTSGEGKMTAEGKTQAIGTGYIFFVGCGVELALQAGQGQDLAVYRAYAE